MSYEQISIYYNTRSLICDRRWLTYHKLDNAKNFFAKSSNFWGKGYFAADEYKVEM